MFCRKINRSLQLPCNLITPVWIKQTLICSYRQKSGLCLENKVVIVTGAGAGIGAATAIAFAKERAKVVVSDIVQKDVCTVAKQCQDLCAEVLPNLCDVSKEDQCRALVCGTVAKFGQIDVLVNNAGILTFATLLNDAALMETYDRTLGINTRACIYLSMLSAPYLVKTKGNIINISSIMGKMYSGNSKYMPYCISKAALDHFMYGAALEMAPYGVRVNNVCPGPVKTKIFATAGIKKSWKDIGRSFKIENMMESEEIADLILYLSSYKAKSITGVRYYIDNATLVQR